MIAFETVRAQRIVADSTSLDGLHPPVGGVALRLASDEVLLIIDDQSFNWSVADPDAIVVDESGLSGVLLDRGGFEHAIAPHIDWAIPTAHPALAQGLVAGVPCKLWFDEDDDVLVLCSTSHVHELEARL